MASNALLELFEQSNEDTQILNQYANTNPFEITKPGAKFDYQFNDVFPDLLKPSFMSHDYFSKSLLSKQAAAAAAIKGLHTAGAAHHGIHPNHEDFDLDFEDVDSKILDDPYAFIDPTLFLGANYDKNASQNISDKDDLHNQCSNVADSSPLGQKLGSAFPTSSKRALTSKPSFDTVFDTDYHVEEIDTQQRQFDCRRETNSTACFKPWAKNYSNPIDLSETRQSLVSSIHDIHDHTQSDIGKDVEVIVADPLNINKQYSIGMFTFSQLLRENGRMVQSKATKTKVQLQDLVRRFCSAKELMFVTEGNAREIVNSGLIEIVKIPLKGKATSGEYNCLICPLTQGHHRGFKRKEDMKRHNQLHFKFQRFLCKHCQYGNARTDHIKLHIIKCHPDKNPADYERN